MKMRNIEVENGKATGNVGGASYTPIEHSDKNSKADPQFYQDEIWTNGLEGKKPAITTNPALWEHLAKEKLPATSWNYVSGSAGVGESYERNIQAFRKWAIIPKRLLPCKNINFSTTVLGRTLRYPFGISPMGVLDLYHENGDAAVAAAAAAVGVPLVVSGAASISIEDIAAANGDGERWFQLYWAPNEYNHITLSLMRRAKKAGFSALILTLDIPVIAWRPQLLDNAFNPFLQGNGMGCEIAFSDPEFQAHCRSKFGKEISEDMVAAAAEWDQMQFPGPAHTWEDIEFVRKNWDGPIVLKGVLDAEDAERAVGLGVQGIWISNHGGRQLDGSVATLDVLQSIADRVGDKAAIILDSGVRTGGDILKALALGADCVMVGRPCVWGLSISGQQGVEHVLKTFLGELRSNMITASLSSVQRDQLDTLKMVRAD